MEPQERLRKSVERQARRMARAERERDTLLSQTVFLGMLALLLVVPTILGAYLGNWIDGRFEGYSVRWTVSFILLGIAVGIFNVWRFLKEH